MNRRLASVPTVARAAFFSNGFVLAVVALGIVRFVTNPHALADGDVGGDFRGFYDAGTLVRRGESAHLYDPLVALMSRGGSRPVFMHPPVVAALFAPLSALPYGAALVVFWLLSLACLAAACAIAFRELETTKTPRAVGLALRFAPMTYAFAYGQLTPILLVPLAMFVVSLRRSRDVTAGAWLGVLALKPQMAAGLGLYLLLQRRYRAAIASLASGALVTASSVLFFREASRRFAEISARTFAWSRTVGARPWAEIGFFRLGSNALDPWSPPAGTVLGVALALAGLAWLVALSMRRHPVGSRAWDLSLAAVVPVSLFLSPYLFHYDAGLLFLSFLLVERHLRRAPLEPARSYFTDERVSLAAFAACFCLAVGPGLSELLHDRLASPLGLVPATLAVLWTVREVAAAI